MKKQDFKVLMVMCAIMVLGGSALIGVGYDLGKRSMRTNYEKYFSATEEYVRLIDQNAWDYHGWSLDDTVNCGDEYDNYVNARRAILGR